ncbi:MAG: disulfide bond formation protein B [Myxococcota bacterium]
MTTAPDPQPGWTPAFAAFLVATAASLGSLFFSEIMELPPCSLCWYQRIFMFPLPLVLGAGLVPYDPRVGRYALPLSLGGVAVALWHVLLYVGVIPEEAAPCTVGVPCSQPTFELFGVLSIPALSLIAFATVTAFLIAQRRSASP